MVEMSLPSGSRSRRVADYVTARFVGGDGGVLQTGFADAEFGRERESYRNFRQRRFEFRRFPRQMDGLHQVSVWAKFSSSLYTYSI